MLDRPKALMIVIIMLFGWVPRAADISIQLYRKYKRGLYYNNTYYIIKYSSIGHSKNEKTK